MASTPDSARIALVTGGAKRLGAAFCLDLARRGWDVWIHYRSSEDEASRLAQKLRSLGRRAWLVQADLSQPGGAEGLILRLGESPPALIVHSASSWNLDSALSTSSETWEASHRLHVWSALVLARFLAASGGNHLVTLLDSRLRDRDPNHFSYAFAKRELALLTRYLAADLAPAVRVNGLAPGLILRAEATPLAVWNQAGRESTPLARTGRTADLVQALRYLLDNPFVTGQILAVDGGRHLAGDLFGSL